VTPSVADAAPTEPVRDEPITEPVALPRTVAPPVTPAAPATAAAPRSAAPLLAVMGVAAALLLGVGVVGIGVFAGGLGGASAEVTVAAAPAAPAAPAVVEVVAEPEPAPAAEPLPVVSPSLARGVVFPGSFSKNAADPELDPTLVQELIAQLRRCPAGVDVVGYTCSLGPESVNHQVGLGRATAVKRVLVAAGLQSSMISVRSMASADPIASNTTEAGRSANRRVVVACSGDERSNNAER